MPDGAQADVAESPVRQQTVRQLRLVPVLVAGLCMFAAVAGLASYWGWQAYEGSRDSQRRASYVSVARQAAINLTTIDFADTDGAVKRILDSSTGQFHNDFQARSSAFTEFVKQAQSKTEGTIVEAGLISDDDAAARVLVALKVLISNVGGPEPTPRSWRMIITVDGSEPQLKVSNVEFVP